MISSEMKRLKNRVAIVGVGTTKLAKRLPEDQYTLAAQAFKEALADCGLTKEKIDGLHTVVVDYDKTAKVLGINARYAYQDWGHGRIMGNILVEAVLVLSSGIADYFAIVVGNKSGGKDQYTDKSPRQRLEGFRSGGGPHGEEPAYGMFSPAGMFAMKAQRYLQLYNATTLDLGAVAVAERKWACLNPLAAQYGKPMTIEDHQRSRWVIEPFRLLDCCMMTDGGVCLILTTAERAKDLKQRPVFVSGMAPVGITELPYLMEYPGLMGKNVDGPRDKVSAAHIGQAYEMADVKPHDIDALYTYDPFTIQVFKALESARICPRGEAKDFIKGGRIEPGGGFPVDTNGGLLSEGHCHAWNHMAEIVRQLRGQCGARQIKNARNCIWIGAHEDCFIFGT